MIYLVLGYHGAVFVDSAWSTAAAAEQRAEFIADSRHAFKAYKQDGITVLEVRLDESSASVQFEIPKSETVEDE
jgi:hypothetical protein